MTTSLSPPEAATVAIQGSGLTKTAIANGLALLNRAHPHNGHITLTWENLLDLFGLTNRGSATRYLTQLSQAGIIHYSTNSQVFVTFFAWTPLRVGAQKCAWELQNLRVGAQESAEDESAADPESARGRAEMRVGTTNSARGRANDNALKGMSERVSPLTLPSEEKNQSITLLTDSAIRMSRRKAEELAEQYDFETIRAVACDWFAEGRKPAADAGLIAYRLEAAETVPPLIHNDLWQRHRTPAEIAAEAEERAKAEAQMAQWEQEQAARQAEAPTADRRPPTASPDSDADLWDRILAELTATMPTATTQTWITGATARLDDGILTIKARDAYAREWLHNRLSPTIQRIASRLAGRSLQIQIAS